MTTPNISWFADIGLSDRPSVGGKGGSLGELTKAGIEVPPGFVVRTEAFERFIQKLDKEEPLRAPVEALDPDDLDKVGAVTKAIRERIENEPMPADVDDAIQSAYKDLCGDDAKAPVAVRSSATTEDADDASFAGLQDTYLWVLGAEETLKMVRSCWASLYSVESVCYRRRQNFPESGVAMGVVVQKMVDARTAGVMFTRSPLTGDRSVITIEGAWGLGSSVVSGEVTPDRWVVGKLTGEITTRDISDKHIRQSPKPGGGIEDVELPEAERTAPCLSDEELLQLKDVARRTEKHYGKPQDIEWAVEKETGKILLLQSRPETVWSAKDAAPVAAAQDNPMKHVMNIFGGKRSQAMSDDLPLSPEDVEEITSILSKSSYDVLDIETARFHLRVKRSGDGFTQEWSPIGGDPAKTVASAVEPEVAAEEDGLLVIKPPLPGTFYRSPQPGAPPFVKIGDKVTPDTVVAIIETMKLMNPVHAGVAGEIVEIIPENAEPIEATSILMKVKPE